jgi:hypothetical protein
MEGSHPSTICVELPKLIDSINALSDMLGSEYMGEYLADFITDYARSDEIMPDDKTVGFVVLNTAKKKVALAFNDIDKELKEKIQVSGKTFENKGYSVEYDLE